MGMNQPLLTQAHVPHLHIQASIIILAKGDELTDYKFLFFGVPDGRTIRHRFRCFWSRREEGSTEDPADSASIRTL